MKDALDLIALEAEHILIAIDKALDTNLLLCIKINSLFHESDQNLYLSLHQTHSAVFGLCWKKAIYFIFALGSHFKVEDLFHRILDS